jgi:8-hydroxy-5-deazaflavin:NADPH oxidoreductase
MVPDGVTVVSALHTVAGHALADLDHDLDEDVLVCGDAREPKRQVAAVIDRIPGLRPVNAGALETARLVEGLTPLLISINARNKVTAGIRLTGLTEPRW